MIENVFVVTTTEGTSVPKVFRESCKAAQEVFNIACDLRKKGYMEVHHSSYGPGSSMTIMRKYGTPDIRIDSLVTFIR